MRSRGSCGLLARELSRSSIESFDDLSVSHHAPGDSTSDTDVNVCTFVAVDIDQRRSGPGQQASGRSGLLPLLNPAPVHTDADWLRCDAS
jgi:hypothetical protein